MRDDFFGDYARLIIKNYRKDQNDSKPTTFSIDFKLMPIAWPIRTRHSSFKSLISEFLEWWVDGTIGGSENEHWQTYRNLLNPCLYQWDYILKLENIEEESKWLFAEFNITEIKYPPGESYFLIGKEKKLIF